MTPHSKKWDEREYRDAIDTIANEAIYRAWRNADDQWEDFQDIGENDWAEVVKHGGRICEGPELRELARAYKYLAARAKRDKVVDAIVDRLLNQDNV